MNKRTGKLLLITLTVFSILLFASCKGTTSAEAEKPSHAISPSQVHDGGVAGPEDIAPDSPLPGPPPKKKPTPEVLVSSSPIIEDVVTEGSTKVLTEGIFAAVIKNDLEKAKKILKETPKEVNATDGQGMTPLHHAAVRGHKEMAVLLIEKGAKVDAQSTNKVTPLHVACDRGHTDVARLLLEKGAKVNAEADRGTTPLHAAALGGRTDLIKLLLDKGAKINKGDRYGGTPMHYAAATAKSPDAVTLLIDKGADLEAGDIDGKTPLHAATSGNNIKIIEMMIKAGADVNAQTEKSVTPLHIAVSLMNYDVVKLLVAKKADPDIVDASGFSPYTLAQVMIKETKAEKPPAGATAKESQKLFREKGEKVMLLTKIQAALKGYKGK